MKSCLGMIFKEGICVLGEGLKKVVKWMELSFYMQFGERENLEPSIAAPQQINILLWRGADKAKSECSVTFWLTAWVVCG